VRKKTLKKIKTLLPSACQHGCGHDESRWGEKDKGALGGKHVFGRGAGERTLAGLDYSLNLGGGGNTPRKKKKRSIEIASTVKSFPKKRVAEGGSKKKKSLALLGKKRTGDGPGAQKNSRADRRWGKKKVQTSPILKKP